MTKTLRALPTYAFLSVASLVSVFPLYFMAVSATNTTQDVLGSRLIPGTNLVENWKYLTSQQDVAAAMYHSSVNALLTTWNSGIIVAANGIRC